ncbi:hypothetical protein ACH4PU_32430 [Streptomyces sp. NPDC021100]|uniref:hypothetical protein n=1 Tax=Streptomyces sp. NPDC021100 TaxID=3365114 RepID=UPI0037A32576
MPAVEYDFPIRRVRDQIAAVVDRSKDAGAVTYITRQGERVAAVVPLPVAERGTRPLVEADPAFPLPPIRPAPSATGGRIPSTVFEPAESPSPEELRWTRAALEALHAHLFTVISESNTLLGAVGQALAALSDQNLLDIQHLLDAVEHRFIPAGHALTEAENLLDALVRIDKSVCGVCREPIASFYGHRGWQHYHSTAKAGISKNEVYQPGHDPQPFYEPRDRPSIVNGCVAEPPS